MLIAMERGDVDPEDLLDDDRGWISVVSVSELLHGVHRARSPVRSRRRIAVERILRLVASLPVTEEIARTHAEVGADLAADGFSAPANDLWIGCTALVHGLSLVTRDQRSFARIPGLRVVAA
jgi:predicted nucleic acid-binding protein